MSSLIFIYDGECPFCNHFAELVELKSKIKNISILDGRKNPKIINELFSKGYDLDKGAILLNEKKIYHGPDAINFVCSRIKNPSSNLLEILALTFKSPSRTKILFPFLVTARRFALIAKGVSTSII